MSPDEPGAGEQDYRQALMAAERALMIAPKWFGNTTPADVRKLIEDTQAEVSRVLDIGRDEANEMVAT